MRYSSLVVVAMSLVVLSMAVFAPAAEAPSAAEAKPAVAGAAEVTTYELDELLGTKLRALYQRRKGRDLFDLWLCASRGLLHPERVVASFAEYVKRQGRQVSRAQFEKNLHEKENDPAFLDDIKPLLRPDVRYEAADAMALVQETLIQRLSGDPWRGPGPAREPKPRRRR